MWVHRHAAAQAQNVSFAPVPVYATNAHSQNIMQLAVKAISLCGADSTPGSTAVATVPEQRAAELERTLSNITRECCQALAESTRNASTSQQGSPTVHRVVPYYPVVPPRSPLETTRPAAAAAPHPEPFLLPLHELQQSPPAGPPTLLVPLSPQSMTTEQVQLRWPSFAAPTVVPDVRCDEPAFQPTAPLPIPASDAVSLGQARGFRSRSLDTGPDALTDQALMKLGSWPPEPTGVGKRKAVKARKSCSECGTMQTCQWRRGPSGQVSLCNACGIRFRRARNRNRPLRFDEEEENHNTATDMDMDESNDSAEGAQDGWRDGHRPVVQREKEGGDIQMTCRSNSLVGIQALAQLAEQQPTFKVSRTDESDGARSDHHSGELPAGGDGKRSDIYRLLN